MIDSSEFINECKKSGFTLFTGTPCSYLKPFINYVIEDDGLNFIEVTNEGDAVAVASGAWLGGRKSVVLFQNSGLGNAVNPITSLSDTMKIPFLGIVTWRGQPGGSKDEPQHKLMGEITCELLELMDIPHALFPDEPEKVEGAFYFASQFIEKERKPFFFVMQKGSVADFNLSKKVTNPHASLTRTEALKIIDEHVPSGGVFIATTGKTGRELFEINDSERNFYMVGSMGCALPIGLGVCEALPNQKTVVIDGDGALLMRLGNMALVGQTSPKNLTHVLLDNNCHDSTGGQRSFSEKTDFCMIAKGCGYRQVFDISSAEDLKEKILESYNNQGPSFLRVHIKPGSPKDLGRPSILPEDVSLRLKKTLEKK